MGINAKSIIAIYVQASVRNFKNLSHQQFLKLNIPKLIYGHAWTFHGLDPFVSHPFNYWSVTTEMAKCTAVIKAECKQGRERGGGEGMRGEQLGKTKREYYC